MENKHDAPTESEMLLKALISQGCTVEEAQRIVRAGEARGARRMSWGAGKDLKPVTRH